VNLNQGLHIFGTTDVVPDLYSAFHVQNDLPGRAVQKCTYRLLNGFYLNVTYFNQQQNEWEFILLLTSALFSISIKPGEIYNLPYNNYLNTVFLNKVNSLQCSGIA
jgi:hypothetical protein